MKIFVLLTMIWFHIIDDYHLQGILADLKQIKWWKLHYPDQKYKHDWIIALGLHAFSWTFMIMLPIAWRLRFEINWTFLMVFIVNWNLHFQIDHLKANRFKINLIQDQGLHLLQILITWAIFLQRI